MSSKNIFVKGAREHNLKNIDLEIPRDKLVVFTGLSGSGKSSLAFDTIYADGQRLWRVLENIFGNVTKYAMEDTRVYAEVMNAHGQVVFTLKNISAQPLNFAAEELTERFVRGDVARGTEGSGLGLSIAKSLTELQGGKFQLYLDGDLFKVTITFQAQNSKCTDAEVPAQPKPEAR